VSQLTDVHAAVARIIKAGVSVDLNVSSFPYAAKPRPFIEVWPADVYYDPYGESYSDYGPAAINLRVRVSVSTANAESSFLMMTELLGWGDGSVRAALMASDRSLGAVLQDVLVSGPIEWESDPETGVHEGWVPVTAYVMKEN
jgi:hypothetical protein